MKILLTLILICSANLAVAELYKSLDENGEVVYSDKPPTLGAEEFKPPPLQVQPPIIIPPKKQPVTVDKEVPYPYSDMAFIQPEAEANFNDNEGNISYALALTPALASKLGHYLNFKLDGTVIADKTSSFSGMLSNVDRGTHTLVAEVCNARGEVLRSASVNFHVHKFSSLHPKHNNQRTPPPAPPANP
ncbi:MAG: DUF4124 domain-containing protein [Gammaproteobacteria bacterium]|nr:DUF4124 domain-containing protein [Gammaproteobacteria bacterium]